MDDDDDNHNNESDEEFNNKHLEEKINMNIISFFKDTVELVTSTQSGVENAFSILKITGNEKELVRISPTLSKEFQLDETKTKMIYQMEKETKNFLHHGDGKFLVDKAYRLVVSSFFYLDFNDELEHDICKEYNYHIKSRIELPPELWKKIIYPFNNGDLNQLFSLQVEGDDQHSFRYSISVLPNLSNDLSIANLNIYFENSGKFQFAIMIKIGDRYQNISGCPLSIIVIKSVHLRVI